MCTGPSQDPFFAKSNLSKVTAPNVENRGKMVVTVFDDSKLANKASDELAIPLKQG